MTQYMPGAPFLVLSNIVRSQFSKTPKKKSSIFAAIKSGNLTVLQTLLAHGESLNVKNEYGYTPVHYACSIQQWEMAAVLLRNGTNGDTFASSSTPFHLACEKGNLEIVKLLIENGANVNVLNHNGHSPLHYACIFQFWDIAALLINPSSGLTSMSIG